MKKYGVGEVVAVEDEAMVERTGAAVPEPRQAVEGEVSAQEILDEGDGGGSPCQH